MNIVKIKSLKCTCNEPIVQIEKQTMKNFKNKVAAITGAGSGNN